MKVAVIANSALRIPDGFSNVPDIGLVSQGTADAFLKLDESSYLYKAPLTRRFYSNPDSKPLKTQMAKKFPLLSRRERRALLWAAEKCKRRA